MGRINILPEAVVNKIAAGEVIERPASVIKELVENAIDAGATEISIEVKQAGLALMRVRDNGHGMGKEDAGRALQRHTTSKITNADDLFCIKTMGFRGEALPSIAAVSRLELTTKQKEDLSGTRIAITGGRADPAAETGSADGTEVVVRDLFFNTPVRRKFLRADRTETSEIAATVTLQALAHPRRGFTLIANDDRLISAPPVKDLRDRIASLFGSELASALIRVNMEGERISVTGFISPPSVTRGNRSAQYFFVNERPVREKQLQWAVMDAYEGLLPPKRHPVVFLYLDIEPHEVDVNVHPAKREVRFRKGYLVKNAIRDAVSAALRSSDLSPELTLEKSEFTLSEDRPLYTTAVRDNVIERVPPAEKMTRETLPAPDEAIQQEFPETNETRRGTRALCQAKNLYVVGERDDGIVIIDQHAAHERILFEKMMKRFHHGVGETQGLLIPAVITLSPAERLAITGYVGLLNEMGFTVEPFGANTLKIDGVPAFLSSINVEKLIRDVIGELASEGKSKTVRDEMAERVAKKVCRAAVKRRDPLRKEELQKLIDNLLTCDTPSTCPHGRPTMIILTDKELCKKFGRL